MTWRWEAVVRDQEDPERMGRVVSLLRIGYLLGPDCKMIRPKQ